MESTSLIELQHESDCHVLDDRDKASPLRLSLTEILAITPPSLIAHTRLLPEPGAQRIGGRNLSLLNSVISEQHESPAEPSLIGVRTMDFPGRGTSGRTDVTGDDIPYAESERMSSDFFVAELFIAFRDRFL